MPLTLGVLLQDPTMMEAIVQMFDSPRYESYGLSPALKARSRCVSILERSAARWA